MCVREQHALWTKSTSLLSLKHKKETFTGISVKSGLCICASLITLNIKAKCYQIDCWFKWNVLLVIWIITSTRHFYIEPCISTSCAQIIMFIYSKDNFSGSATNIYFSTADLRVKSMVLFACNSIHILCVVVHIP